MRFGVSDECGKAEVCCAVLCCALLGGLACVKIKWVNKGRLKYFRRPVYVMMIY